MALRPGMPARFLKQESAAGGAGTRRQRVRLKTQSPRCCPEALLYEGGNVGQPARLFVDRPQNGIDESLPVINALLSHLVQQRFDGGNLARLLGPNQQANRTANLKIERFRDLSPGQFIHQHQFCCPTLFRSIGSSRAEGVYWVAGPQPNSQQCARLAITPRLGWPSPLLDSLDSSLITHDSQLFVIQVRTAADFYFAHGRVP